MIIVDTGPLYAAADSSDAHHAACSALFIDPSGQLVIPVSVVIEASLLIERHLGATAEAAFLGSLATAGIIVEHLTDNDLRRHFTVVRPEHAASFTLVP